MNKKNSIKSSSPTSKSASNGVLSKPGSGDGRLIHIINYHDESIQERVLLNPRTTQSFDEVLQDLGHMVKLRHADKFFTPEGFEVKSFSELRNIYAEKDTFYISTSLPGSGTSKKDFSLSNSLSPRTKPQKVKSPRPQNGIATNLNPIKVTVKGAQKEFFPPTKGITINPEAPSKKLVLDWVFGYNGGQDGNNLFVTAKKDLVYFVATIIVVFNPNKMSQRHYNHHTEDVTCIHVQQSKNIVISGQRAGKNLGYKAAIHVWSLDTLETVNILEMNQDELGVCSVATSNNTPADKILFVAVVQEAKSNYIGIWDWSSKTKKFTVLGKVSTGMDQYSGCSFHSLDNHLIITFGKGHLIFWNQKKDGSFEQTDLVQDNRSVTDLDFLESGDVVAGDDSGMIGIYSVNNKGDYFKSHEFEAHKQGVASIILLGDGTLVSAGIQDCSVTSWNTKRMFERIQKQKLPDGMGSVKSICLEESKSNFYVGTDKNCIMGGSMQQPFQTLVWGHSKRLSSVAAHPVELGFVTTGYDKVVTRWSKQNIIWQYTAQSDCLSATFHPGGNLVAISTLDGQAIVLGPTGAVVWSMQICASPINTIEYSPAQGNVLGMASHNGTVHTFSAAGNIYKRNGRKDVGGSIMNLDWSEEGDHIQVLTVDYNLVFLDAKAMKVNSNPSMTRDCNWHQQTCTLGWAVAGAWNNSNYKNNPTTITAAHVDKDKQLLAVSDAHGYIRLFNHPCTSPNAKYVEAKAASSAITSISFMCDDQYLLSAGSTNVSLMRWKII